MSRGADMVERMAAALEFPAAFFFGPDIVEPPLDGG